MPRNSSYNAGNGGGGNFQNNSSHGEGNRRYRGGRGWNRRRNFQKTRDDNNPAAMNDNQPMGPPNMHINFNDPIPNEQGNNNNYGNFGSDVPENFPNFNNFNNNPRMQSFEGQNNQGMDCNAMDRNVMDRNAMDRNAWASRRANTIGPPPERFHSQPYNRGRKVFDENELAANTDQRSDTNTGLKTDAAQPAQFAQSAQSKGNNNTKNESIVQIKQEKNTAMTPKPPQRNINQSVTDKKKENSTPNLSEIKSEKKSTGAATTTTTVQKNQKPEPTTVAKPPPSPSSSSSSSSEDTDSSESEVAAPVASAATVKKTASTAPSTPKKATPKKIKEDEVVCLGKVNNKFTIETDDDESSDSEDSDSEDSDNESEVDKNPKITKKLTKADEIIKNTNKDECMICDKSGHTSFQCQMICKNCSAPYHNLKSCPLPANLNTVMQSFMEFCMQQLNQYNPEQHFPFPRRMFMHEASTEFPSSTATAPTSTPATSKKLSKSKRKRASKESNKKKHKKRKRNAAHDDSDDDDDDDESESSDSASSSSAETQKTKAAEPNIILPSFRPAPGTSPFANFHAASAGDAVYNPAFFSKIMQGAFNYM